MKKDKIEIIKKILPSLMRSLEHCDLCLRQCGINRIKGEEGFCESGALPVVYNYSPHHGEEPPLSGRQGSGTIFFSRCNLGCVYCQNYKFSQYDAGGKISSRDLSDIMLNLQQSGCHNINLVSPTHFVPMIVEALLHAYSKGLTLPVVYNTGGYDSVHVIQALKGIVDIYLPDMRYSSNRMAEEYSKAPGYVSNNRIIVSQMYRQVGNLSTYRGIARKGLIIRLLMLPGGISGTLETLEFIARKISKNTYLSVMSQYYPAHKANSYKELSHRIGDKDYYEGLDKMHELGLCKGWVQPFQGEFDKKFAGDNL